MNLLIRCHFSLLLQAWFPPPWWLSKNCYFSSFGLKNYHFFSCIGILMDEKCLYYGFVSNLKLIFLLHYKLDFFHWGRNRMVFFDQYWSKYYLVRSCIGFLVIEIYQNFLWYELIPIVNLAFLQSNGLDFFLQGLSKAFYVGWNIPSKHFFSGLWNPDGPAILQLYLIRFSIKLSIENLLDAEYWFCYHEFCSLHWNWNLDWSYVAKITMSIDVYRWSNSCFLNTTALNSVIKVWIDGVIL